MSLYKVEEISYGGHTKKIVCQDKNGPCPLLAIVNYISLTRNTKIKPDINGFVSEEYLFRLVRIVLDIELSNRFKGNADMIAELRGKLFGVLPNFAKELHLNPYVNRPQNSCCSISWVYPCSMAGLWIISCHLSWASTLLLTRFQDAKTASALDGRSYNDLVKADVMHKPMETFREELSALTSQDEAHVQECKVDTAEEQGDKGKRGLIKDFMENTKMQLTSHGLSCLRRHMFEEQELKVLYMNGHFQLMHLHSGTLHALQTDSAIRTSHPNAVWQILENLDGDNFFVTGDFHPIKDEDEEGVESIYLPNKFEYLTRILENINDKAMSVDEVMKKDKEDAAELIRERESAEEKWTKNGEVLFARKTAEANKHEDELLKRIEMERIKKEKQATKKAKYRMKKIVHEVDDNTHGALPLESTQCNDAPPHEHKQNIESIPEPESWVFTRFMKFLSEFDCNGKSETPYFEGEVQAMKHRNSFELSIHYSDIHRSCEELAVLIRDYVHKDLKGCVAHYLEANGVSKKKAEEAELKFHGVPQRYRSFVDFAEENRSKLIEFHELYQKVVSKSTAILGRRMGRGFLKYIIGMHKKGLCWNGKWKAEHMKVRNDGKDFVITEVPNDTTTKEGMTADFKNFFEIIFPFYEHDEIDSVSGKKKKVLPCYFLQFKDTCMEVPEPDEHEKLEKFQRFLGCHPAFMSPAALSTLICHLYRDCDSLRKLHDPVYKPLQVQETLQIEWRTSVKILGIPFSNVYWHFVVEAYELGYWFLLKYLRNFIEHAHRYTKEQGTVLDIVTTALMIGEYLSNFVPKLILFIVNNCDIDGPFSTTWTMFEDSD